MPDKTSPLGPAFSSGRFPAHDGDVGVTLSHRLPDGLVQAQAWPDTVADVERAFEGRGVAMATGPGRWLIEGGADLEAALRGAIPAEMGAVTGLTHARTVFMIEGQEAAWIVACGFPLDVHPDAWPVGETRVTRLHHDIGVTLRRDRTDAFTAYVFTSFARSFWHWLTTVAAEVGYEAASADAVASS